MQQPKSLAELARKVINQRVASMPRLRDLTLPPSIIRYLEETYLVDHLQLIQFKKPDQCYYPIRFMWKLQKTCKATNFQMAALQSYTGEDAPFGYDNQTVISEWYTFTYKDRVYKMCLECGESYYKKMGKRKIILYGNKTIPNNHDLLVYAKNPDNWCHLCLERSLFWIDNQIHEEGINQQVELEVKLVCRSCLTFRTDTYCYKCKDGNRSSFEYHTTDYFKWIRCFHFKM